MKVTIKVELCSAEFAEAPQIQQSFKNACGNADIAFVTDTVGLTQRLVEAIQSKNYTDVVMELVDRLTYQATFHDSLEVLCTTGLLSVERVERGEPVDPLVEVLLRLPPTARDRAKAVIVHRIMSHFSTSRRLDCSRLPLIPYAETMATMVQKGLLSIHNVVLAIVKMIRNDTTRTAGMTCLGKLVEVAYEALRGCDQSVHETLRTAVGCAQLNDIFLYDVEYIMEAFGWAPSKPVLTMCRTSSHHEHPILSLAYCGGINTREVVVTSSVDGTIGTWDGLGGLMQNVLLSRHYAACVDLANRGRTLVVGAVGRYPNTPPAVILYNEDGNRKAQWQESGGAEPPGTRFITTLKCIPNATTMRYCVGVNNKQGNAMLFYDGTDLLHTFYRHSDIITAMHVPSDRDNTVITGSRDCSTIIYDLRSCQSVSSMTHHHNTVSSFASFGDYLFSSGLDKRIILEDMRMLGNHTITRDMDSAILSLSVNSSMQCAVSTLTGIYLINFASGASVPTSSRADCAGASSRFNSICWNTAGSILYAGGESCNLTLFAPSYEASSFDS